MNDAIVADGVRKRYGVKTALDGLDLAVRRGTVHGLLGPNGAGKTTAVRVLTTLLRPDEGRVEVAGHDVVRAAVRVLVGLVFPVMLLLMFGYLVGGGRGVQGRYVDFLVPGMLALTMAFGLEGTMLAVTQDLNKGVVDRFRSMPMTNGAVLVGRSAADMLQSALGLAVLVGVGYAIGWRAHGGPGAFLAAMGLLLLFRFAMLWIGIQLAMVAGRPEMVQAVQILVWPVGFLSNAFAIPDSMPGWLGTAVQWNPMSQTARAVRDLFGGPGGEPGHVWAAVAWPLALLAVFFPLAVRRFARLSR